MEKKDLILYWHNTSDSDFKTMNNLFKSKDYHWSLFIGHLVIEKLLKGIYVKNIDTNPPKTHDLLRLAEQAEIELDEEKEESLDLITTFNINARYPDYKQKFYEKCTEEFTSEKIEVIKGMRMWLLSILEKDK